MPRELLLSKPVILLSARLADEDRSDGCVNIFNLLMIDHGRQRDLMKCILNAELDNSVRLELFEELQAELTAHAAAKEQTFYAELLIHARETIQQSVAGNDRVDELRSQLCDLDVGSPKWLATFTDLKAEVESQLDFEEAQLFPRARRLMKRSRAKHLGKRFEQMKLQELCLDRGCPLQRRTGASLGHPELSLPMKNRQQPRSGVSSQAGGRGLRKRAMSRGLPHAKGE